MEQNVQIKLFNLNRRFYDQFAGSFSDTRNQAQPGVRTMIGRLKSMPTILDVGCGNGTLARALQSAGYEGRYLGIDLSEGLLDAARTALSQTESDRYTFQCVDLGDPDWASLFNKMQFSSITSFAVLHHLPGDSFRIRTARLFHNLLKPDGFAAISVWQWQNSPRLVERVIPWTEAGLQPEDVDEGDVLLDWRAADQIGLRYVHTFSEESLTRLANQSGFTVEESFLSDGKPGNLALYQLWRPT